DIFHSLARDPLGEMPSGGRRDGAGVGDDHAVCKRWFDTVGAEEHALDRRGIGEAHPDYFDALSSFGGRRRGARAFHILTRRTVPYGDFMTGLDEIAGHRVAHDS